MTEQQINKQLSEEFKGFQNSYYEPKTDLDLVALFKKCYRNLGLQQHKIPSKVVKEIANAKEGKLTVAMCEDLFKVLLNVPLGKLFNSFEDAVAYHAKMESCVSAFNTHVDNFTVGLQIKGKNLQTIANPSGSNGMRVIAKA